MQTIYLTWAKHVLYNEANLIDINKPFTCILYLKTYRNMQQFMSLLYHNYIYICVLKHWFNVQLSHWNEQKYIVRHNTYFTNQTWCIKIGIKTILCYNRYLHTYYTWILQKNTFWYHTYVHEMHDQTIVKLTRDFSNHCCLFCLSLHA